MTNPLPGASNSRTQQPQEQEERQNEAMVSGKHVTSTEQAKHLESTSAEAQHSEACATAKVIQPVYSKLGTELSSPGNPFAMHLIPPQADIFSDSQNRLNNPKMPALELNNNNVRLQLKILNKAMLIAEEKMRKAMQNPSRDLGKLFDSIQDCYAKCWNINNLLILWESPPADINTSQINQRISVFENRFVHFLMTCKSPFKDQQQDLLFMCIWFLRCKETGPERENTNRLNICRKTALLFLTPWPDNLNQLMANRRLVGSTKNNYPLSADNVPSAIFFYLSNAGWCGAAYSIHRELIEANIKKQLQTDPLFQGEREKQQLHATWLNEVNEIGSILAAVNRLETMMRSQFEFSYALSVIKHAGFIPFLPSSPGIGLTVLQRIYNCAQLPDMRADIYIQTNTFTHFTDPFMKSLCTLLQFLAGDDSNTDIILTPNEDLKLYLQAMIHYLKAQWSEAEKLAEKSRWPEAIWLCAQLCYQRGDLAHASACLQKAVEFGVDSALLQLINVTLELPIYEQEAIEQLFSKAIRYHSHTHGDILAMRIHFMAKELRLSNDLWENDPFSTPPSTEKKKAKGKKRRQRQLPQYLTRPQLAQLNLRCIEAMNNWDYDQALELLVDASISVGWDFQQATLGIMDLWRLAEMATDYDYLYVQHQLAVIEGQPLQIPVLRQDGELLRIHKLNKDDNITLTDSAATIREKLCDLVIKKSVGWLCLLHNTPDANEQWRQAPDAIARQQLEKFEYSPLMTFFIALLLTTVASVFKGKASSCPDPKMAEQHRHQSLQFFNAASEFYRWQNLLNENDKLKTRIEAATPLGSPQKLAKRPQKPQSKP